ncbi:MAG: hypothetical protein IBX55_13085 [Methyloprofundus sp.]|nr:hypothetical protein [Methyloprofundus sp.]
MGQLVSQRQFAKEIGRSHVWVSRLVKDGRLPVDENGKIDLTEGKKAYQASQQVGFDTNRANAARTRKTNKAAKKPAAKTTRTKTAKPAATDEEPENEEAAFSVVDGISVQKVNQAFNRAKLAEKTYQAKLKELEYKEAQRLLIPREEVLADARETAEELRGILFSMPPRIAPLCEGKLAREIEAIIEDGINQALAEMQKSAFLKAQK